jgi:hypothetical protein
LPIDSFSRLITTVYKEYTFKRSFSSLIKGNALISDDIPPPSFFIFLMLLTLANLREGGDRTFKLFLSNNPLSAESPFNKAQVTERFCTFVGLRIELSLPGGVAINGPPCKIKFPLLGGKAVAYKDAML